MVLDGKGVTPFCDVRRGGGEYLVMLEGSEVKSLGIVEGKGVTYSLVILEGKEVNPL